MLMTRKMQYRAKSRILSNRKPHTKPNDTWKNKKIECMNHISLFLILARIDKRVVGAFVLFTRLFQ